MQFTKNSAIAKSKFIDFSNKSSHTKKLIQQKFGQTSETEITINEALKRAFRACSYYEMVLSLDNKFNINL